MEQLCRICLVEVSIFIELTVLIKTKLSTLRHTVYSFIYCVTIHKLNVSEGTPDSSNLYSCYISRGRCYSKRHLCSLSIHSSTTIKPDKVDSILTDSQHLSKSMSRISRQENYVILISRY